MVENTYIPQLSLVVEPLDGGAPQTVYTYEKSSEQFAARLRKTFKESRKWARKAGVYCYRIYDADLPDYAVAIDVYECVATLDAVLLSSGEDAQVSSVYLHIAEYQAPKKIDENKVQRRFEDIMAIAPVVCGIPEDNVFVKLRCRDKGGQQYAENRPHYRFLTQESGLRFEVDLNGYLDTGLFLDHRVTRERLETLATGKRFLNLFSYTGSATVHAAKGGALETTTVDLSQTYLDWAQRNMQHNGFAGPQHHFERGDVLAWLRKAAYQGRHFDVVFVDPPTFSNSKATQRTWDVQRDHVELLTCVKAVLAEGGIILFSCNLRSFKLDYAALQACSLRVKDISAQTIPRDFERNAKIHYCFELDVR